MSDAKRGGRINVKMWKKLAINTGFECELALCNPTPHGYLPALARNKVTAACVGTPLRKPASLGS